MRRALNITGFVLLCIIWGSTWLVIKVGYGGLGPFNVAGVRFAIAAAILAVVVPIAGARWPHGRAEWTLVTVVGILLFVGDYGLIYWAEQYIDSGLTAILFGTFPLLTMAFAHVYVPGERLTRRTLAGGMAASLGVVALFGDRLHFDASNRWPMAAIVGAAACAAASNVAIKRHGAAIHSAALNASSMLIGAVLLLTLSWWTGEGVTIPPDLLSWAARRLPGDRRQRRRVSDLLLALENMEGDDAEFLRRVHACRRAAARGVRAPRAPDALESRRLGADSRWRVADVDYFVCAGACAGGTLQTRALR